MRKLSDCTKMLVVMLLILCAACATDDKKSANTRVTFDSLMREYYEDHLRLYPIEATLVGDNRYNDQLPNDITQAFNDDVQDVYLRYKAELLQYNYESLSEDDKLSYDVLMWECDQKLGSLSHPEHLLPVNQFWSRNLLVGDLASGESFHPFKTVKDYNDWLSRLRYYVTWCDSAIANMRKGVSKGVVIPKVLVEKSIPQWDALAKGPVKEHQFFAPVTKMPETFSEEEKQTITHDFISIIEEEIIPTHARMRDFLQTEYLPAAQTASGVGAIPGGKEYYNYLIKYYTTTDMTADEIFNLGQKEVARINAEVERIKNEVGYRGDMKSFLESLRTKKELMPFTRPEQVIEHFNEIYERMKPNLEKLFKTKPKTPFVVQRTPAFREASSSAEYYSGSADGSRPGVFYIPIPDVKKYNIMGAEYLFLHEAIPGHHYQISLQLENESIPQFRRIINFNVYAEGWALYTESLGKELGLYTDPYQYLGMLAGDMHRAVRLVVDVGIHAKGWTREQAIEYSLQNESQTEEAIIAEIERYMAIPGQALCYKIGQLKIRELREYAEQTLGDKFDIAEFHDEILKDGALPLTVLDKKIRRWVDSKK